MTERELVEHILKRTKAYISALQQDRYEDFDIWDGVKLSISPFMLRGLCETWLKQDDLQNVKAS